MTRPAAVARALDHVRHFHPQVTQVVFLRDGRWRYMDDEGDAPSFGPEVDQALLEEAADAVHTYPAAFAAEPQRFRYGWPALTFNGILTASKEFDSIAAAESAAQTDLSCRYVSLVYILDDAGRIVSTTRIL